jgi:GT2 family glycosyltransferase
MFSIIAAVHNQLGHNQLFLESIKKYTTPPYEVIVIDNHSSDGSGDFFESQGCRVIRNQNNLCYPESMNLGIRASKGDLYCLINNDVLVGPNWNEKLMAAMDRHGLDACSPMGLERMPTPSLTGWMYNRWSRIGKGRLSTGKDITHLRKMINLMYGNWEDVSHEMSQYFYDHLYEGIIGAVVLLRRSLVDKIGLLDERIQASDWDMYLTIRKREKEYGDVRRCMVVGEVYVHHFIRATVKGRPAQFSCLHPRISLDDKWDVETKRQLWFDPLEIEPAHGDAPRSWQTKLRRLGQKASNRASGLFRQNLGDLSSFSNPEKVVSLYRKKFAELGNNSGT